MTDIQRRILEAFKRLKSKSAVAREFGVSRSSVRNVLLRVEQLDRAPKPDAASTEIEREVSGTHTVFTTRSANIKTLDEALAYSKVDMEKYQVDRFVINSWETTMGGDKTPDGNPRTYTNYQVKVWLLPKTPEMLGMQQLFERIREKPLSPVKKFKVIKRPPLLCEISIYDHHFGMLAWNEEVHDDYDNKIARHLYNRAVDYLLAQVKQHDIEEFLIPVGHDLFHFQNEKAETPTSRNRLDVDGRLVKVWEIVQEALIRAITRCLQIAPVKVYWIPGNHDPELSFGLCSTLGAYFRLNADVEFDLAANHRKYHSYGNTIIGMTHGVREKPSDLLGLMLEERPMETGQATCREFHRGHKHKEQTLIVEGMQKHACMIRQLPSLAAQDKHAHFAGYSKSGRAAKGLFYSHGDGYYGEFNAPVSALG